MSLRLLFESTKKMLMVIENNHLIRWLLVDGQCNLGCIAL